VPTAVADERDEQMTDNMKLAWSKPKLRRIDAGSAEAKAAGGIKDGGSGGTQKS